MNQATRDELRRGIGLVMPAPKIKGRAIVIRKADKERIERERLEREAAAKVETR